MFLQAAALVTAHFYASTPERAALRVIYPASTKPAVVRRVNVVGPYATVLTSGGLMESNPVGEAILLQRFSFGWQALEILDVPCRLHDHALGARNERVLMSGMPRPHGDDFRMCSGRKDAGSAEDVQEVRRLVDGPFVPSVIVSHVWAMAEWYGAGGGMSLWRKRNGRWRLVQGGGGAIGRALMRMHGVPESEWCTLGVVDARCR